MSKQNLKVLITLVIFFGIILSLYPRGFCTKANFELYCKVSLKKEYRIDHVLSSFSPLCDHVFLWINTEKEGGGTENCFICVLDSELSELENLVNSKKKSKCGQVYKIRKKDFY